MRRNNPLPQLVPDRVQKLKQRVDGAIWRDAKPLRVTGTALLDAFTPLAAAKRLRFSEVRPGSYFGPANNAWRHRWMRAALPEGRRGEERWLHFDCVGETTAYLDGKPWAGFDVGHRAWPLPAGAREVWFDVGAYSTAIWAHGYEEPRAHGTRFDGARLTTRDDAAWELAWDLDVLVALMELKLREDGWKRDGMVRPPLERCQPLTRVLLHGLDAACDAHDRAQADPAKAIAACRAALAQLVKRVPAEAWQPLGAVIAQSHLDLVWLWPESVTRRKAVHTCASMQRLIERYDDFRFMASQPAMYRMLEEDAPSLSRAVSRSIAAGRWEALGGFEVEPDNHLPCGEALARSLALGQAKLRELTGAYSTVCWLPDVFGYSACLPQLLKLAGVEAFFTTKMSWSAVTRFPHSSFVWRGADGSEVLAHLQASGYNGSCELDVVAQAARDFRQTDVHGEMIVAHGLGDGAGGPTMGMIERVRRMADLAGAPKSRFARATTFFQRMAPKRDALPVWQGEMYLEYHRGTYTSQARFKRAYRALERALQAHEAVRVAYGGAALDEATWRRLAFAQFHDAIPGSSIAIVYQELGGELERLGEAERAAAAHELAKTGRNRGWLAFNPLAMRRVAVVEVPEGVTALATAAGERLLTQRLGSGAKARTLAALALPALGGERIAPTSEDGAPAIAPARVDSDGRGHVLDNGLVRARFDARGRLIALAIERTPLALAGPVDLALYPDNPHNFDAWDIDHQTVALGVPALGDLTLTAVERGPVRAALRAEGEIAGGSRVAITYALDAGSRWLRVEVEIDWRTRRSLLKLHVPTAYRGRDARYGTPFGSVARPQQPSGPSEEAQWEVPGNRWAAVLDDAGEGLAIVTEASYGFGCRDGELTLSLVRHATNPDPDQDIATHRVRLALGRHRARFDGDAAPTAACADLLFTPPIVVAGGELAQPPLEVDDAGSLVPAWVSPAADGDGWILRLHETAGARGAATLRLAARPTAVELVDLLGRKVGGLRRVAPRAYELPYGPYQVLSVRVR